MEFTHLHLHTEYSLLDGANKIGELAKFLKEKGFTSVAITDHGNMYGAIDFYKTMKKNGIKPIIGIEAYIHNGDELNDKSTKNRYHLILLAKNEIGYKNLLYLTSMSFIEGFYYYPRINKKILKEHSEGLICSTACLQGEVNFHLNLTDKNKTRGAQGYERAKEVALEYKEIFGDDFYLEIMRHGINDQRKIDTNIIKIAKETGIKLIATNDAHYLVKKMGPAHNVFMAISMGNLRHSVSEFYVKSKEEMARIFADIPEVLQNTQEIVNKCNLELKLGNPTPPNFKFTLQNSLKYDLKLPETNAEYSFANDDVLFEYESRKGLQDRLKFIDENLHQIYYERLEREIKIIKNMKFSGYMLIVADFINWAKQNDIPVGPGRGSAAGSLVAYSLKITDINPIPYNLLFERFLNPQRVSMPDIDVDFCQEKRGKVIDYVVGKYGRYNVAQVATFGKLLAKGVIRDVARVCEMPYTEADKMAKLIPDELKITLKDAYDKEDKIKNLLNENPSAKKIWDYALDLEGLNRNSGMHAAGVVISNEPLWNKAPLFVSTKGDEVNIVTQYTKDYLEDVDLIKFDFLGLKTLDVIDGAKKLIKMRYNKDIVWQNIDFNEFEVYKTIQSGNTLGIFQIESAGMQKLASDLKPDNFEDIIAMIALYRPGPMDLIPEFIDRKHGIAKIEYLIPEIKDILEPTYGIIVYQEQVMQIVQKVGGFTLGGADIVRRAMSKKKEEEMKKIREEYLQGAKKGGFDLQKANELFDMIMKFASYGFNKSHAAAYAMITFQTAYLKTYYPSEFMAAIMTSEENNLDKISNYINEIKRLNIGILPPDLNKSIREFSAIKYNETDAIIYGFGAIKGVGEAAIENILEVRKNGEFKDLDDFVSRVDNFKVNKKVIESLIGSGAFDCFGKTRLCLMQNIEAILDAMKKMTTIKKNNEEGSLFGNDESMQKVSVDLKENSNEYPMKEILNYEFQCMGIYLSGHPLGNIIDKIRNVNHTTSAQFKEFEDGINKDILLFGKIEDIKIKIAKSGSKFAILNILDSSGNFELLCYEKSLPLIDKMDENEKFEPHAFLINIKVIDGDIKTNLVGIYPVEDGISGKIMQKDKPKEQKTFYHKKQQKDEPVGKQIIDGDLVIHLNYNLITRSNLDEIYRFAFSQNKDKIGTKKLILKIQIDDEIYTYKTNFIVNDDIKNKFVDILVA